MGLKEQILFILIKKRDADLYKSYSKIGWLSFETICSFINNPVKENVMKAISELEDERKIEHYTTEGIDNFPVRYWRIVEKED